MEGAYSTHGRDEKCVENSFRKTRREETTWRRWNRAYGCRVGRCGVDSSGSG
jgi:hypothetical protein